MGGSVSQMRSQSRAPKTSSSSEAAMKSVENRSRRFGRGSPTWAHAHAPRSCVHYAEPMTRQSMLGFSRSAPCGTSAELVCAFV